jgi:dienelactone hydrolase
MRRRVVVITIGALLIGPLASGAASQVRPTVRPADYGQFETVTAAAARGGLSPDGKWLAYSVARENGDAELRIREVGCDVIKVVPFGSSAVFASSSQWIAYSIGMSEAEQAKLTAARQPIRRKAGILHLPSGAETIVDGIESFSFDRAGRSIAMKRATVPAASPAGMPAAGAPLPVPGAGRGGAASADAPPLGGTLLVRDLATGVTSTFGNVTEYGWQPLDTGELLAMIVSGQDRAANSVQIFDAESRILRALDSRPVDYSGLAWRDGTADLAVLRAQTDARHDGPTQAVLVWTGIGTTTEQIRVLDHTERRHELRFDVPGLSSTQRVVSSRRPEWIESGDRSAPMIVVGVGDWPIAAAPQDVTRPAADTARGAGAAAAGADPPDLDVWHWNDAIVMPRQKLALAAERRRSLPAVWHLSTETLVLIGQSFDETLTPVPGTSRGLVAEYTPYLMERSIGRPAADWLVVDLRSGARTRLVTNVRGAMTASPGGRYAIFPEGGHYWTIDLATRRISNITSVIKTSFVDTEGDSTGPQRPAFGIAGWTTNDEWVVLNDRFDVWRVSPTGAGGMRLTDGRADQVRHRLLNLGGRAGDPVDLGGAFVSLFGTRSKRSGYGRLAADGSQLAERLIWLDKGVAGLARAERADVYSYRVQSADDPADLFVGGAVLADAKQETEANAFLSRYAWTRATLVDYTVSRGRQRIPLQGVLHYPANYEPGRKYPMVVYLYERLSDGLHTFENPSERDYYNGTAFTQDGYFYFQPDIVFAPRNPGVSVVECVTAAVAKVVEMGMVDPARIGVMGHSWGGFDAMYLATHTRLFAAAVSGAGISNLVSNYGNHHWSSGIAETDHIETGQQRMVVPLYEDLPAYVRNSAIFGVADMATPLLLMTGDNDGTVYWHQSVELYNVARRARKNVVMLVYNNEDHSLRQRRNQIDYHRRIHAWFDHYLKGAPAGRWITDGVPASMRGQR